MSAPDDEYEKAIERYLARAERDLARLDRQMFWVTAFVVASVIIFFAMVLMR